MTEPTHVVHGVPFVRTGSCNRCGACHCEKLNCGHFSWDDAGKAFCSIHDTLKEEHQGCIDFPDNPWIGVIKSGKCGYMFFEIKIDDKNRKEQLDKVWGK